MKNSVVLVNYKLYQTGDNIEEPTLKSGSNSLISYAKPNDYLCCSIYNSILGLLCLGIPAIIISLRARKQYEKGFFIQGDSSAKTAKILNIIGISVGTFIIIGIVAFAILIIYVKIKSIAS
jgi:hypothetical protein